MIQLALFEPEIPQNTGTLLRLGACLGLPVHIIEPCSFVFDDARLKRSGMDYLNHVNLMRHNSFDAFKKNAPGRLILLDVNGTTPYTHFNFLPTDTLLLGRESNGVPPFVFQECITTYIPMRPQQRSLNVAIAAAMVLGEALRQTNLFPEGGLE